jgi:hypothetical protein
MSHESGSLGAHWGLDVAGLRTTLDRLQGQLNGPPVVRTHDAARFAHDGAQIVSSIKTVLLAVDSMDMGAASALSGMVREFRPPDRADELRDLISALHAGIRGRVLTVLGQDKIDVANRLLSSPTPDLLRILGREDDENSHSDLIAWLLNPRRAPTIAGHALHCLVGHLADSSVWRERLEFAARTHSLSVRREYVIARELSASADLARADIVLTGPGLMLVIENKVWSREHSDQTKTYWQWIEPLGGMRGGIFLSPGGLTPVAGEFRAASYLQLVACLLEGAVRAPLQPTEEIVLGSYLKTLARQIIPVEMRAVRELKGEA